MKEYRLQCDERIRLDRGVAGSIVFCREGILWVTQTGTPGDRLLRAGEAFSSNRAGRIVIGALEDSVCSVAVQPAAPERSPIVLLQALGRMLRRVERAGRRLWA